MGELLTLEEVGKRMKIKAETVRRSWVITGKLQAFKVGRGWRIDADHLEMVLAKHGQEDAAPITDAATPIEKDLPITVDPSEA